VVRRALLAKSASIPGEEEAKSDFFPPPAKIAYLRPEKLARRVA
jgi:hypothetical protein